MTASKPLQGSELIDCAKANAQQDIEIVAEQCGYGKDVTKFQQMLKQTCDSMGIEIENFADFRKDTLSQEEDQGEIIAPDSKNQL